jgi:hypothetical protein
MKDVAYDGTPVQGGMQEHELTGTYPQFSILGVREMVVVGRRYSKDNNNRSKTQVEYAVRDLRTGDVFPGARVANTLSGAVNGEDIVLHPAQKIRKGSTGAIGLHTPAASTDGDRVLVAFLEGSRSQPVIIGVFRHPDATYGAVEADGERRLIMHNGLSFLINKDGELIITHKSGSTMRFADNGDVEIEAAGNIIMANASVNPISGDGVVTGTAIDPFTGQTQNVLGNASAKVFAKK